MPLRWYAARTRPLAEYVVRGHLETAGFGVFLPCGQTRTPRPGHQDAPLFPGYLFLRYDLEKQGWGPVRRVPQLVGLVSFGKEVPAVPDDVMDDLVQRVKAINGRGGLWPRFRPGERVRVALGPTESLAEVVEPAKSPRARVRVLLEFLGRTVEAKVPWRDLQPVSASGPNGNWHGPSPRRTRGRGRWIKGHGPRVVEGPSDLPGSLDNGRSSS